MEYSKGQAFNLFDDEIRIPETCLADKIWNWLWNEAEGRRESAYYLLLFDTERTSDELRAAYRQLLAEGRIEVTPRERFIRAVCKEPPGWFD